MKQNDSLKRKLIRIGIKSFFKPLDWLVKKDSRLIVFSQKKSGYSDNTKALFEYICNNKASRWKAVWLYQGKPQQPCSENYVPLYSIKGFCAALRAKFFMSIHGTRVFRPYVFSRKTHFICLWHGIPVKAIRFSSKRYFGMREKYKSMHEFAKKISLLICSSKQDQLAMSSAFQVLPERVVITGLPRSDNLFKKPSSKTVGLLPEVALTKKTILYAPTWRENRSKKGDSQFFPFDDFDEKALIQFLVDEDAYLLLRAHPERSRGEGRLQSLVDNSHGHICFAHADVVLDVNELLPFVNVVITDYSSIYVDLLLTDTPCVFVPYDLAHYEKNRSLIYDYDEVTPGPKVITQQSFMVALKDALGGAPAYQKDRKRVRQMFHQYSDGGACERVLAQLEKLP